MRALLLALAAAVFVPAARADLTRIVGVAVDGSEFKVAFADGRVHSSRDPVGLELEIRGETVRIDAVERDSKEPSGTLLAPPPCPPRRRWALA